MISENESRRMYVKAPKRLRYHREKCWISF